MGARVAWHHVSRAALELGVEPEALAALAEAVFIFVDQLSSASARGYVLEQSEAAGARERLRDELVELLLSDRSDDDDRPRRREPRRLAAAARRGGHPDRPGQPDRPGRAVPVGQLLPAHPPADA